MVGPLLPVVGLSLLLGGLLPQTGKAYARMALGTGLPKRRGLAQSDAGHGRAVSILW